MATGISRISELEATNDKLREQLAVADDARRKLRYQCVQYSDAIDEVVREQYKQIFKAEYKRGWIDAMDSVVNTARTYPTDDVKS